MSLPHLKLCYLFSEIAMFLLSYRNTSGSWGEVSPVGLCSQSLLEVSKTSTSVCITQ